MAGKYEIDMCNGKLAPQILKCAMPLMLTNLLQLLYNVVDTIVMGRFAGKEALAAVGSTSSLISLIINMFVGLSVGTSVIVSLYIGKKDSQNLENATHTSILVSIISGIFLAFFGVIMAKPLLVLMNTPEDVLYKATLYMKVYFLGMPGFMLGTIGSALMRSVGDTKRPLFCFTIAGVVHVILDLVVVLGLNMGVEGVALSTIISQYLSAVLILYALCRSDGSIKIYLSKLRVDFSVLAETLKYGLPVSIQMVIISLSNVIIQSSINSFDSSTIMAGNAAAVSVENFLFTVVNTFCLTQVSFAGQNFGAKKYRRIDKSLLISVSIGVVSGFLLGQIINWFAPQLLGIYTDDLEAVKYGMIRFKYVAMFYFIDGAIEALVGTVRGLGYSIMPMMSTIFGICGVRIIWIYTIFASNRSLDLLYTSFPISWVATLLVLSIFYMYLRKKLYHITQ